MDEILLRQAHVAFGGDDFKGAAELCRRHLAGDASSVEAWRRLGSCQLKMGEYADAVHSYEQAIGLDPRVMRHSGLALALRGLGDNVAAAEAFKESLKLRERASGYVLLACVERVLGRLGDAEASCRRALELSPQDSEAMYCLGRVLDSTDPGEAMSWFREAVKLDPTYADAHRELGIRLVMQSKGQNPSEASQTRAEAMASLQTALVHDPSDSWAHAYLALEYDIDGRLDEAEEEYLRACAVAKEGDGSAHQRLGEFYRCNDRLEDAEKYLRMSIDIEPDEAKTSYLLGLALLEQGKKAEAVMWLKRTLSLHPDEATKDKIISTFLPQAEGTTENEDQDFSAD